MTLRERVRNVVDRIRGAPPYEAVLPPPLRIAHVAVEEKPARSPADLLGDLELRLGAQSARAQHLMQRLEERLDAQAALAGRLTSALEELTRLGEEIREVKQAAVHLSLAVSRHMEQAAGRELAAREALEEGIRRATARDQETREGLARQVESVADRSAAAVEAVERHVLRLEQVAGQRHDDLAALLARSERWTRICAVAAAIAALLAVALAVSALL